MTQLNILPALASIVVVSAVVAAGCVKSPFAVPSRAGDPDRPVDPLPQAPAPPGPIAFRDMAAEAGVRFQFETGTRGRHDLPEIMAGGVALFDADGDGRLDIYACNGGPIEPGSARPDPPCRLFLNRGAWHFVDVTSSAGAPGPCYAMGAAAGDYDGDRRTDLFVCGWRGQRLYRNLGGAQFEDVTDRAGVASGLWSTSAAFADLDGDGDLDLYVANYLDFDPRAAPFCAAPDGRRDYCGPEDFPAQADRLYRNNGNGTFTDIGPMTAIDKPSGRGLGVLIAELTGDNRPDIYVANDGSPCWLFANRGNLQFDEIAERAGVARDGQATAPAGMGVAAGDWNRDGSADLFVTNFFARSTVAFQAQPGHPGSYQDASQPIGLTAHTRTVLGFGIAIEDFDGDGCLDLFQLNGHVLDRARLGTPMAMKPTLLRGTGRRFENASDTAGNWFGRPALGRALAIGDLDDDGRPDAVATALDAPLALLRNITESGTFLVLDVFDRSGRSAVGARVRVAVGGQTWTALVTSGGSYQSASSPAVRVGLPTTRDPVRIEVEWPWGIHEFWTVKLHSKATRLRIEQGSGRDAP
jgi:hypothetical protein